MHLNTVFTQRYQCFSYCFYIIIYILHVVGHTQLTYRHGRSLFTVHMQPQLVSTRLTAQMNLPHKRRLRHSPRNKAAAALCATQTGLAWRGKTLCSCQVPPQGRCKRVGEGWCWHSIKPPGCVSLRRKSRLTCVWVCWAACQLRGHHAGNRDAC